MKDYLLLLDENEKLKRIINAYEFYDDEVKSTTSGERLLTFKMNDSVVDIENGNKIGAFIEGKFDLFIVDQVEAETYYSTSIKVTCLHDFYSIQTQKAITQYYKESVSVYDAMTEMLKGTSYELGECVERALISIGPYLYKNPLWCIQDIISSFGVEIDYSIELNETRTGIAKKIVHVVNALGSDTGIRCSTDLNVNKIKRVEKDKFYTVMYGCGAEYQKDLVKYKYDFKDISWSVSNGNSVEKPVGQEFVEDKKAIAKYGRIIGIFEDGRIKDPELLLKKTWQALQKNNRPIVSYELDIEELKNEDGYEHLNFKLGDIIILQNTMDNSRAKFRIVEDCKGIRNKNKRKVTVGEQLKGIFSGGNSGNNDGTEGPGGSVIGPGGEEIKPPSIEDITPDTLPAVPIVTAKGLWKTVQLSWTYENKMYYNYEVYASKIKDFEPLVFNMIYSGKASAFLHEAGPSETWYYRVRAVNTFGNSTEFSQQVVANTTKLADGTEYFETAAIKDALIEELRLDRGWIGQLDATYLNVKGKFTILDGNNERTLYVDSFGRVELKPSVFTLMAGVTTNVPTKSELSSAIGVANSYTDTKVEVVAGEIKQKVSKVDYDNNNNIVNDKFAQQKIETDNINTTVKEINKDYVKGTEFDQTMDNFQFKVNNSVKGNELFNSDFAQGTRCWKFNNCYVENSGYGGSVTCNTAVRLNDCTEIERHASQVVVPQNPKALNWTLSAFVHHEDCRNTSGVGYPMVNLYVETKYEDGTYSYHDFDVRNASSNGVWTWVTFKFGTTGKTVESHRVYVYKRNTTGVYRATKLYIRDGHDDLSWQKPTGEIHTNTMVIDGEGWEVRHIDGSKSKATHECFEFLNSHGNRSLRFKDGGMNLFTEVPHEMVGYIKPAVLTDSSLNGVNISTYAQGDFICLGHSTSNDEGSWTTYPQIMMSKYGGAGYAQGTTLTGDPLHVNSRSYFNNVVTIHDGTMIEFGDTNANSQIFTSNGMLAIFGDNGIKLGPRVGASNISWFEIQETTGDRFNTFGNWNFNGWTMRGMNLGYSLRPQSPQLKARTKDLNDAYTGYSMTEGEIRYTCRETQVINNLGVDVDTKTVTSGVDRTLVVELPQILSENMELDYHVNISKLSWGDYRIVEKNPYYFIIEASADDFQFTYEIVGKRLFDTHANSIIASHQYRMYDSPEKVVQEDLSFTDDTTKTKEGKQQFWKLYRK